MIAEDIHVAQQCEMLPAKRFNRMPESHHTIERPTPRGSAVMYAILSFFNFLYSAFDYQAATRESTRKKFERHL